MSKHDMLQLDQNERVLLIVKRTGWGLVPHLLVSGLTFAGFLAFVYWLARYPEQANRYGSTTTLFLVGLAIELLVQMVLNVLILTYRGNRIVVTNQSIVQRLQTTLFHHKTSQLQLSDIEDVTFTQNGIIAETLNYGVVTVETAGEQANFIFRLASNPRHAVRVIIEAQEAAKAATQPNPTP